MSLIDSFFIINTSGATLFSKTYAAENQSSLITEFYKIFSNKRDSIEDYYPILTIKERYCTYSSLNEILIVTFFSHDNIASVVEMIQQNILSILRDKVKDHNITIENTKEIGHLLGVAMDHMFDYGFPLIEDRFPFDQIIKKEEILDKIETTISKSLKSQKNVEAIEKYVDSMGDIRQDNWFVSSPQVNGEILFDVLEYLDCIIEKNGNIVSSDLNGEIKVKADCYEPTGINVFLSIPNAITNISFHPCLYDTMDSFEREKILSCKLPQGSYTLFSYKVENPSMRVPFDIIPNIVKVEKGRFKMTMKVKSNMIRGVFYIISDYNIKIYLPINTKIQEVSATKGITKITEKENNILWKIGVFDKIDEVTLTANFDGDYEKVEDLEKIIACVKYQVESYTYSNLKIEKATFEDEKTKLSKKARLLAKSGFYEIRLN